MPSTKTRKQTNNPATPEARIESAATLVPTVEMSEIEAIVGGYHGAAHNILGPHRVTVESVPALAIRVFRPLDSQVYILHDAMRTEMTLVHPAGFFEALFMEQETPFPYRLLVVDKTGAEYELEDPYRFPFTFGELDYYLHGEGNFLQSYEKFGAHFRTVDGVSGVNFAVWAPNASRVSVIGTFNGWDDRAHPMSMQSASGIWELFIPNLGEGTHYKYSVKSRYSNYQMDKSDPYAFFAELRPSTDSRVWNINKYEWHDQAWMENRSACQALNQPINIYEVHAQSWRRVPEDNGFLNYRDLAHQLVDYAKEMGYTHIELLPITEHPFDGSWGYQVTGYFAPTSRMGTPDDLMYFIDYAHQQGIGVILDWVPAHFPKDAHGLGFFDGSHLYEHSDPRQGEHEDWGTKIFNFGRNEVRNFLLSSAIFWLKKYHIDGLRVDAVASMLYLDYSRKSGDWLPNRYGGRENLEAIDFLRKFNEVTHSECPGILTIAEESTSWPMVSRPTYTGGLGFDMKWNMGWMHDMLSYMEKDPVFRRFHQNEITFSLMYAFSENFVLPFSHDEVVHLKKSMIDKMPGDLWRKFANLRALYGYMAAHPGKKLLFMGSEFGQWSEWNEAKSLDWHLLQFDFHRQLQGYVAQLNQLYKNEKAFHEIDTSWEGFSWIDLSDAEQSVVSFVRKGSDAADQIVVICNFTPVVRNQYRIGLPSPGQWREILNSDWVQFGGSGVGNPRDITSEPRPWQSCQQSASIHLPPLGVVMLKIIT